MDNLEVRVTFFLFGLLFAALGAIGSAFAIAVALTATPAFLAIPVGVLIGFFCLLILANAVLAIHDALGNAPFRRIGRTVTTIARPTVETKPMPPRKPVKGDGWRTFCEPVGHCRYCGGLVIVEIVKKVDYVWYADGRVDYTYRFLSSCNCPASECHIDDDVGPRNAIYVIQAYQRNYGRDLTAAL